VGLSTGFALASRVITVIDLPASVPIATGPSTVSIELSPVRQPRGHRRSSPFNVASST
jgi:hypothetical protein